MVPRKPDDGCTAEPADAAGSNWMPRLGAHGIVIDPFVCHPTTEAPFQRVIDGNDQRFIRRDERVNDHPKQDRAEFQRRPDGTIEDTMVDGEVPLIDETNGPQGRCDGTTP